MVNSYAFRAVFKRSSKVIPVLLCFCSLRSVMGTCYMFPAGSSDWFIVLFMSVVIGQSDYFSFGLRHSKTKIRSIHLSGSKVKSSQRIHHKGLD